MRSHSTYAIMSRTRPAGRAWLSVVPLAAFILNALLNIAPAAAQARQGQTTQGILAVPYHARTAAPAERCLDVSGGSRDDGAAVIQYRCNGGENQRFTAPSENTTGELRPRHASGKCLDVSGANRGDGAKVILYACNGGANQRFTRTRSGELRAQHSGKCLDVSGASQSDGAAIIQYRCNGGANQRFRFTDRGELRPAHSAGQPSSHGPGDGRPSLQAPFPCGQQTEMHSFGHAPALDIFRVPRNATEGNPVVAAAAGVVK